MSNALPTAAPATFALIGNGLKIHAADENGRPLCNPGAKHVQTLTGDYPVTCTKCAG